MMEILRFLFYAFLFYLAFRLLFDFIIPIYRTTKKVRKGFRQMQEQMNQHTGEYNPADYSQPQNQNNNKGGVGEYIDFEEVKD